MISPPSVPSCFTAKISYVFLFETGHATCSRISPSFFCPPFSKECKLRNCWPFEILKYSIPVVSVRTALYTGHWLYRCTSRGLGDVLMMSGNNYLCFEGCLTVHRRHEIKWTAPTWCSNVVYWSFFSWTCFGRIRRSSSALDVTLQHMVFCTQFVDGFVQGTFQTAHTTHAVAIKTTTHLQTGCRKPYAAK